jgi:hypothetical protein
MQALKKHLPRFCTSLDPPSHSLATSFKKNGNEEWINVILPGIKCSAKGGGGVYYECSAARHVHVYNFVIFCGDILEP